MVDIRYPEPMAATSKRLARKQPRQRKRRRSRLTLTTLNRVLRECWRVLRAITKAVLALPPIVRVGVIAAFLLLLVLGVNWGYQVFHKPTEIFFPLDRSLNKHPVETWREYESLFRKHATAVITPEFLAALAQVEGGGNPVARTYWRWEWTWNPLEWYQPASSAVGMYQMTDGTFREATQYCIHDHVVVEVGPWHDLQSCWFNSLYTRVLPSHAIELTSALLDRRVTEAIGPRQMGSVTIQRQQDLAAMIHLCGAGAGRAYAARGFRLTPNQLCGDHDVKNYLTRIHNLQNRFIKRAERKETIQRAR